MNTEYYILSKATLKQFPFQQTPKRIVPVEPDLLLEMTFSPKIFIIDDISSQIESVLQHGVEWLDARVDCSPSKPSEQQLLVYENFRMSYIHQTYRLTDREKQDGKLNWLDIDNIEFQWERLKAIPLEERLLFKLEEDFGVILIHERVIELLKPLVKDIWVRGV